MATAGSGDVLCGILCGLFGYSKADAPLCAACGAYINGMAGEYAQAQTGPVGMLSSDTVGQIARAVRELTAQQGSGGMITWIFSGEGLYMGLKSIRRAAVLASPPGR